MILTRFLPEILKELLKNVPTLLFDVTDWKELSQIFPQMSKRLLSRDLVKPLTAQISSTFAQYNIQLVDELPNQTKTFSNATDRKLAATALLKSYFQQIYNKDGQLLDFRDEHFSIQNQIVYWRPNGAWANWSEEFRTGLIDVYQGFFFENEEMFRSGLKSIRLIQPSWNQTEQDEMASLFHNHFQSSMAENMVFKISDFQDSFLSIFHYLMEKKVRMSADFMYLGMMLVTLYLHLEKLESPLSVKEIFQEVTNLNKE